MTQKSIYHIARMDCPSEESMVRIRTLRFDLEGRTLEVVHDGDPAPITASLEELELGSRLSESKPLQEPTGSEVAGPAGAASEAEAAQRRLLWTVLAINFGFFVVEVTAGFLARSMGLVADSLDMLADAIVYGLSLWAVGAAVARKKKVATLSGYFQMSLALLGLLEVVRRFVGAEASPDFRTMIVVSVLALIGNSVCLYLLQKSRDQEAHIKASMIFASNDVVINGGVILAGVLVLLTQSRYPDLIIGAIVFAIVVRGAVRILKLGR